ncbi:MAG: hypothetical protein ACKVVP_18470 [Chloroflexota bacterium]
MGLWFSDTMQIDPMLEDAMRVWDTFSDAGRTTEFVRDIYVYECETAEPVSYS